MRIGLSLPHYDFSRPGRQPIDAAFCLGWGERAERLGFDTVWISDHFVYSFARYGVTHEPIGSLEPITTLGALTARTEQVRLGTLVLGSAFRRPAQLAKAAATLDRLSGGRVDLGLGAGWLEQEFEAFGYRFGTVDDRFRALGRALEVCASSFAEPRHGAGGPTLTPAPSQRPIPIWVGGKGGPRLLRLAARHAAGWNVVWRFTDGWYESKLRDVEHACAREDRDLATFRRTVGLYCVLGEDEGGARAAFARGQAAMPGAALDADTYETWRDETLSGTPDDALRRLASLEAMGVEEVVVAPWVLPFAIPEPEQVELFAERVLAPWRAR